MKLKKRTIILWGLFSFFILLIAGGVFYYQERLADKLKSVALQSIREALGPNTQIEEIHLRLLPSTLILKKITFPPTQEGQPPFTVEEAKIALSRWSLLTEVLVIKKITLKGPQITLIRDKNGQVIWPAFSLNPPRPDQRQKVLIRRILIEDGHAILKDLQKSWSLDFPDLDASVIPNLQMKSFEIEFTAQAGEMRYQDLQEKNLQARGKLKVNPSGIDMSSLEVSMGNSSLTLHGNITRMDTPQPLFSLLVETELYSPVLQRARLIPPEISGKAQIRTDIRGVYPALKLKGNAQVKEVHYKTLDVFTGKMDFLYSDGTLTIPNFQGKSLDGDLSGQLMMQLSGNYQMDLKMKDMTLEKVNPLIPQDLVTTGLRLSGEVKASGKGLSTAGLNTKGWLKANRNLSGSSSVPFPSSTGRGNLPIPLNKALIHFNQIELKFESTPDSQIQVDASLASDTSSMRLIGTASLDGTLNLDLDFKTQDISEITKSWRPETPQPKPRFFDLAGDFRFSGTVRGSLTSPHLQGSLTSQQALLREKPMGAIAAEIRISEGKLSFNRTVITKPPARYVLSGQLVFGQENGPQFSINATVNEGSAGEILRPFITKFPLEALVNGGFTAQGDRTRFLLKSALDLKQGNIYGQHFQRGEVTLEVMPSQVTFSRARLQKEHSTLEGSGWISFDKRFSARITSAELHPEDLDFFGAVAPYIHSNLSAEITGSGDFHTPEFRGEAKIKELVVSDQKLPAGQIHITLLSKNLAFAVSVGQNQAKGLLRLEQGLPIKADLSFVELSVDSFLKPFYPKAFEKIALTCSGQVAVSGMATYPMGLQIQTTLNHLTADISGYKVTNHGDTILEFNQGNLQVKSFQLRGEGTSLSILGEAKVNESLNLFINGEADLDIFRLMTQEFSYGKGKAYLVLKITDQWNNPKIHGGLTAQEGTLRSETLGQTLTIHSMGLFFNQRQILLETLEGEASGGQLKATGKMELKNLRPDNFGLVVDLVNAKASLGEGFSMVFNGNFIFQGNFQSHQLRGEAQIQKASYTQRVDFKTFVAELQKKQQPSTTSTPFLGTTRLDVHFAGKDNIWINNNVAKIPLEMDLLLKGTYGRPLLFGHVEAREGEIYFRRHVFTVQSGAIDFINQDRVIPILDLKAQTRVRQYEVVMNLTGRLDKALNLDLVSDPPLSQTDILALLTVGKTAEEITAQSGTEATEDAISVPASVLFDEFVEDKVKELTGIDYLQVDPYSTSSKAASGPRLTVQKRLLDDQLTVTYISAVDPAEEEVIKLEYQLGRNVSVIGERDENGRLGGDLKLRLEFR